MAWKARITGIVKANISPSGEVPIYQYQITTEYFEESSPTITYQKGSTFPSQIQTIQILNMIKEELGILNSGDTLQTTLGTHLNQEIDVATTW